TAELKAAEPSTLEQERAVVAAEITRLEGARQRLLDLLETGDDPGGVRTRLTERTRDLNTARARAEHLEGQAISDRWADPAYLAKLQAAIEERRVYLSGHPDRTGPLPVAALRSLLRKLLDVIIIERTEDGIGVRFNCVLADSAWIEEKPSESVNSHLTTRSSGERAG
ncbi:MAG TPA: hypothetical protein VNC82_13540, partial [Candidatus Limnocylindria bacterium]|nr:hypothetical protein [Candidatus Limnocylindria bacterium]